MKKTLLSLGIASASLIPVISVVSCGNDTPPTRPTVAPSNASYQWFTFSNKTNENYYGDTNAGNDLLHNFGIGFTYDNNWLYSIDILYHKDYVDPMHPDWTIDASKVTQKTGRGKPTPEVQAAIIKAFYEYRKDVWSPGGGNIIEAVSKEMMYSRDVQNWSVDPLINVNQVSATGNDISSFGYYVDVNVIPFEDKVDKGMHLPYIPKTGDEDPAYGSRIVNFKPLDATTNPYGDTNTENDVMDNYAIMFEWYGNKLNWTDILYPTENDDQADWLYDPRNTSNKGKPLQQTQLAILKAFYVGHEDEWNKLSTDKTNIVEGISDVFSDASVGWNNNTIKGFSLDPSENIKFCIKDTTGKPTGDVTSLRRMNGPFVHVTSQEEKGITI